MKKILLIFNILFIIVFCVQAQEDSVKTDKNAAIESFTNIKTAKDLDRLLESAYEKIRNANAVLPEATLDLGKSILVVVSFPDEETEALAQEVGQELDKNFNGGQFKFGSYSQDTNYLKFVTKSRTGNGEYVCGGSIVLIQGVLEGLTIQAEFYQHKQATKRMLMIFEMDGGVRVATTVKLR